MIAKDNYSGIDEIYKRWSPNWDFKEGETEYIKNSFKTRDRLDAALGYYWSFREDLFGGRAKKVRKIVSAKTTVPTLCLVGDTDGALDLSQMKNTTNCYTGKYSYEIIQGVGHFLHQEAPDVVLDRISAFLEQDIKQETE